LSLTIIVLVPDPANAAHPLAGRPMVRFVVDAARGLQPANLVVVVGPDRRAELGRGAELGRRAELVRAAVGDGIICVSQGEPLGTGHTVQQAEQMVAGRAETVLVLPGNTPLIRPETLQQIVERHQAEGATVTLLTCRPEVNSGIACFRDRWLWSNLAQIGSNRPPGAPSSDDGSLTDLAAMARAQGQVVTSMLADDALEVTGLDHPLKLAQGEAKMRQRINERWMLAGVTFVHPETTYVDADVAIGVDTILWPNTFLQGQTSIGRGCTIGPGSVIRNSTVGDRCTIELSVVEGAIVEDESNVGPFGHLRKGAHLARGVHMGNFGEVKNSYLGPGVKMGHFSYLGDATVGAGANIGAGTITCNYDGQRKNPTVIGEGAFIGSDTMLVAPVQIGDGAVTGAGSVVTRDVPADTTVYGVPARVRSVPPSSLPAAGEGAGTEGQAEEMER